MKANLINPYSVRPPITPTFITTVASTSGLTTYTFSTVSFGTANVNRWIIFGFAAEAAGARTLSSVTIGGVSASTTFNSFTGTGTVCSGIAWALVPTGTTGDIVVTLSGAALRCGGGVYSASLTTSTPVDGGSNSGTNTSTSVTVTCEAGGIIIASECLNSNAHNQTWTNATEQYDGSIGGGNTGMSGAMASVATSGDVAVTAAGASDDRSLTVVSLR